MRLEPLTQQALPELHAAIGHPAVFASGYGGGPAAYRASVESFIEWARGNYRWSDGHPYLVRLVGGPHDGQAVGTTTMADFDETHERTHIGWTAYDPRVWGTAVNPECKLLLLDLAFRHGYGRVHLQADAANERSRAAISRLGATFEGVLRRHQRRADGTWRDNAMYSILADEWPAVRAGLEARLAERGDRPVLFRTPPGASADRVEA